MRAFIRRFSVLFCTALFFPLHAFATHNRAGEITYVHLHDLTYQFTITTYTDPNSPANRPQLTLYYGDGTFDTVNRISIVPLTSIVQQNKYISIHTFPAGNSSYVVSMQDPNRVDGIVNILGSVNVPFYIYCVVIIPDAITLGYNSSPILTNPPIDYANVGEIFTHNPGAFDSEGDELRYQLIVPLQAPGIVVPGYVYPQDVGSCPGATFVIDSITGEITWNVPCLTGIYNCAFTITERRNGIIVGIVERDMEIFVEDNPNHPPVLSQLNDTCVYAGDLLNYTVTATDPDLTQTLTLSASGGPLFITESPATFISTPATGGFVSGQFSWQTECDHVRKEFYEVVFKVQDNYQSGFISEPLVDLEPWLITVVGPPPLDLTATPSGNHITIKWDSLYTCFNSPDFLGFSVWRKIGCDTSQFDKCQRGLDGTGFDSIAFVDSNHYYIDNSVLHGQIYCYRVCAEFGEHSEIAPTFVYNEVAGAPSNGACAELKRDLPIINHASVNTTSPVDGSIYVAWYKPLADDLDTIQNPGPYKYIVDRYTGLIATGTPVQIATFTSDFFATLNDTSVVDTLINTESSGYTYKIEFYSDNLFLGSSETASSVFLTSVPHDNRIILTWTANVPWLNVKYDIYRQIPGISPDYEYLATTDVNTYTDAGLANGADFCYYIKAYGVYSIETLPDTLINYSQKHCDVPVDNEPPCAPSLVVNNICNNPTGIIFSDNDLKNVLIWTDPDHSCADDVVKYLIYYTPVEGGQLALLDSILISSDTTYSHENLESIAGCYAVVAVDSFNNMSPESNLVCVDNCSDYNLPNAFTPNGDGQNDLYTPILPYHFIDHVEMKIFDRWGNLVFETNDPMLNWDGKDKNGKDAAEGVYYYVCNVYEITVSGVQPVKDPKKGYIHLVRGKDLQ